MTNLNIFDFSYLPTAYNEPLDPITLSPFEILAELKYKHRLYSRLHGLIVWVSP